MSEVLDDRLAMLTEQHYCCATCWGHLIRLPAEGRMWTVECAKYGSEHSGFVTKYYRDRRLSDSVGEAMDVRYNLWDVLPFEGKDKTIEDILEEIGG